MKKNDLKKVAQYYDERAKNSDQIKAAGQWGEKEFVPLICEEICKKINIKKSDRVLELGCGSGVLGNWIKNKCDSYVGLDVSRLMLKKFSDVLVNEKKMNLFQAVTDAIPFSADTFDIIIINSVIMYFQDDDILKKTFSEMERVATKNGVLFIGEVIVPSEYCWELVWFQNLPTITQFLVKPYVRLRRWRLLRSTKFEGKWKSLHRETSPKIIKKFFGGKAEIIESKSAAYKIRQNIEKKKYKGHRRMDFIIKLQ